MLSQYILYTFENFVGDPAQRDSQDPIKNSIGLPCYRETMCPVGWTNQCQTRSEREGGCPSHSDNNNNNNRGGGCPHASAIRHGGPEGKELGESTRFGNAVTAVSDTSERRSGVLDSITDYIVAGRIEEGGRLPSDVTLASTSIDFCPVFPVFPKEKRNKIPDFF